MNRLHKTDWTRLATGGLVAVIGGLLVLGLMQGGIYLADKDAVTDSALQPWLKP